MPTNDYTGTDAPGITFIHPVTGEEVSTFQSYKTLYKSDNYWHLKYTENGHTCLVSNNIFIADIDDVDFNWQPIVDMYPQWSFRVYRTFKGFRIFITNSALSIFRCKKEVDNLFVSFNCDTLYTDQVWLNSEFAARLTPKEGRKELCVCRLISAPQEFEDMHSGIRDAIKIHDYFCL